MNKMQITLLLVCSQLILWAQNVQISSGYTDNNRYKINDSLHIYALDLNPAMVFDKWEGTTQHLGNIFEWHSKLKNTIQATRLTAVYKTNQVVLQKEDIQGRDIKKEIWFGFPQSMRGVIWFFHGTGGSVNGWVNKKEGRKVVDYFLANQYGVIIMESEETSLNRDLDADGKIRWSPFPADSNRNVDIKNMLLVRQEFIRRGLLAQNTPQFSLGMSNGGAFSAMISAYLRFKAGSSYCAPGESTIFDASRTAFQWCMAEFDNNPEVGFNGNLMAQTNASRLEARNIPSDVFIHQPSPMAPGRVKDATGLGLDTIQQFFDECIKERIMDTFKIPVLLSKDGYDYAVLDYPARFPSLKKMTPNQILNMFGVWAICLTEHQFYSDAMYRSLRFFNQQIGVNVKQVQKPQAVEWMVNNLVRDEMIVKPEFFGNNVKIYNLTGNTILEHNTLNQNISLRHMQSGTYIACMFVDEYAYCEKIEKTK